MRSPRQLTESHWNLVRAMVRRRVCAMGGVHELFFFESRGSRGELGAPGAPGGRNRREPRRRPSSTYPVRAPSLSTRPTRRSTSICSTSRTRSTRSSGPAAPDSRQNGASLPPARRRVPLRGPRGPPPAGAQGRGAQGRDRLPGHRDARSRRSLTSPMLRSVRQSARTRRRSARPPRVGARPPRPRRRSRSSGASTRTFRSA